MNRGRHKTSNFVTKTLNQLLKHMPSSFYKETNELRTISPHCLGWRITATIHFSSSTKTMFSAPIHSTITGAVLQINRFLQEHYKGVNANITVELKKDSLRKTIINIPWKG